MIVSKFAVCLAIMSTTVPLVLSAFVPQPVHCKESPCPVGYFCGGGPQVDFWYCKPCSSICDSRRTQSNESCKQEPMCASFRERTGTEPAAAISESTSSTTSVNAGVLPVATSTGTAGMWTIIAIIAVVIITMITALIFILRAFYYDRRTRVRRKVCPFSLRLTTNDNATTATTSTTISNIGSVNDVVDDRLPVQESGCPQLPASSALNDGRLNDETEPLNVNSEHEVRQQSVQSLVQLTIRL